MKTSVVAIIAYVFLAATPAFAAHSPVKAIPPSLNWSGFYVGGHAGYGWTNIDETSPDLPGVKIVAVGRGFLGGGQFGVNWEVGRFVLGAESDISGSTVNGDTSCPEVTLDCQHKLTWLTTVRARGGVLVNNDRTLIYATAGGAWAHIDYKEIWKATNTLFNTGLSHTHSGWTAGGGIEQMITPRLSVKLEYLYVGLNHASTPGGTLSFHSVDINPDVQTVRVGFNYKFWGL